jgi:uncharacterized repeat protein (TIGR01451 family)
MAVRADLGKRARRLAVVGAVAAGTATWAAAPAEAEVVEPIADLSVGVSHSPSTGQTGVVMTFTITVDNAGPDAAQNVVAGLSTGYRFQPVELPDGCSRDSEWSSVICDVGELPAGETATLAIGLRPYGAGVYTLPAVAASDTLDPDDDDLVESETVIVKKGPSQAERYIAGIFPMILERPADPAALDYWVTRWKAENQRYQRDLAKIPLGIMNSNEYRRLRIRESYQQILGRAADAPSLTYWVNRAAKGLTFDQIDRALLLSPEFARKAPVSTVHSAFQALYGRQPTAAEVSTWSSRPLASLVRFLQTSVEGRSVVIRDRALQTLGEEPSALLRYVWLVRYAQGATTERLWAELLVSYDVLRDYPYTEDDYADEELIFDLSAQGPELQQQLAG